MTHSAMQPITFHRSLRRAALTLGLPIVLLAIFPAVIVAIVARVSIHDVAVLVLIGSVVGSFILRVYYGPVDERAPADNTRPMPSGSRRRSTRS